ncbi:MAG TPA: hypothetical protein VGX76_16585 [Pirellulales bacterium]|jgi:hypothetical protein|nr:hypothetical protein [Pirellulales bacterium]
MPNQKLLAAEHALEIDPEFAALCPGNSDDETAQLRRSLIAEGCRDDLVVWNGTKKVLDGMHRLELCLELNLAFGVTCLDLPDRAACKQWITTNQLARRNISSQGVSYLRGLRYLAEKAPHGGDHAEGQATYHDDRLETAQRLADEYHVGVATIYRDATFARAVQKTVAACGQRAKHLILARDSAITRRDVFLLAHMSAEAQVSAI